MKKQNKVRSLIVCGLFSAIIAVLTFIHIPLPSGIPLTLQIFAVALCGYTLGSLRGISSTAVYIALGAVGLPVFSGFMGGVAHLAGPTGGFLWGFLLLAALCGLAAGRKFGVRLLIGCAGLTVCHLCGVLQFSFVMKCSVGEAFLIASAPYLIKDAILTAAAAAVSARMRERVN